VLLRTSVNLKEEGNRGGVLVKSLLRNDLRKMVVPYMNDAMEALDREIVFRYPELARRAS
jgi:hypothetical protein